MNADEIQELIEDDEIDEEEEAFLRGNEQALNEGLENEPVDDQEWEGEENYAI